MIEESINWDKEIVFGAVSDWYVPGLLDLCQKYTLLFGEKLRRAVQIAEILK